MKYSYLTLGIPAMAIALLLYLVLWLFRSVVSAFTVVGDSVMTQDAAVEGFLNRTNVLSKVHFCTLKPSQNSNFVENLRPFLVFTGGNV